MHRESAVRVPSNSPNRDWFGELDGVKEGRAHDDGFRPALQMANGFQRGEIWCKLTELLSILQKLADSEEKCSERDHWLATSR